MSVITTIFFAFSAWIHSINLLILRFWFTHEKFSACKTGLGNSEFMLWIEIHIIWKMVYK